MYRGESVLIVSEDVTARQAILEALHLHTHRLRSFVTDSVATGIAYLDACHVSTVVLEVPLRYASAFRVLIDVGQRKPSIPVVALVDGLRPQEGARAIASGAYDVVWKPVRSGEAYQAIRFAIETYRLRQQLTVSRRRVAVLQTLLREGEQARSQPRTSGENLLLSRHALLSLRKRLSRRAWHCVAYVEQLRRDEQRAEERRERILTSIPTWRGVETPMTLQRQDTLTAISPAAREGR